MSFSEIVKQTVKEKAAFTCCWCRDLRNKVEIHHIIAEAEGGSNTEENAAPLCSNCHTLYGGNPELRKEIKARRDNWFEQCASQVVVAKIDNENVGLYDIAPPLFGRISMSPLYAWMHGVDSKDAERHFIAPRAYPLGLSQNIRLDFDITNPNEIDMRIIGFRVLVIEYVDVEVLDIWARGIGGGVSLRKYDCEIKPSIGCYDCGKVSEGFDFIRLSKGELEVFSIELQVDAPGLYRIQVEADYSIGGKTERRLVNGDVIDIAFLDFSQYEIRRTHEPLTDNERL